MLIKQDNKYYIKATKREQSFWANDYFGTQNNGKIIQEIQEYENFNKSGNKDINYLDNIKSLGKFHNGLSLGGGFGEEELSIVAKGVVENMTFVDFSEGSNTILRENAEKLNIKNKVFSINGDLNFIKLEKNTYDFIICRNVLHHIINLEECLFQLNNSLTENGIIVIDEFIGANKFQWSTTRIEFIKTFCKHLKEKFDIETLDFVKTNKKSLTNNCPFEAIRSEELYNLIHYYFGENQIQENRYGYLFEDQSSYVKESNSIIYTELLKFEKIIKDGKLFPAPRIFGVYKKGNKEMIQTQLWTNKEIKENIGILPFSELQIMRLASKLRTMFPGIYENLKKIYFLIRR
ncbi:hypothetical protein AUK10_04340 [Candidatus Gracilibacteria bacterium CG2_30_37_12]|nr:MAG: hypothetical protein AUK10_04340 [Candidatus Gracilibacteria bacterium CG2_30_37_12]